MRLPNDEDILSGRTGLEERDIGGIDIHYSPDNGATGAPRFITPPQRAQPCSVGVWDDLLRAESSRNLDSPFNTEICK